MRLAIFALAALASHAAVPAQQPGTFTTSGNGCPPCAANAIYEIMPSGAWDLSGVSITFAPAPPTYAASQAGAPLTLVAPSVVPNPGDDQVLGPFPIGFTFGFQGGAGSSTMVDISTNGHIYFEAGTTFNSRCCTGESALFGLLAEAPSVSVLGTDLNPGQGGTILYETLMGSNPITAVTEQVFVVEWRDVPEFPINGANTIQGQLWADGAITVSHITTNTTTSTHSALVGVSAGGGEPRCPDGGIDFTTDLPFTPTMPFSNAFPLTLAASGSPNLGKTVTIRALNVPTGATAGSLLFSNTQAQLPLPPGAPPGCELLVGPTYFAGAMNLMPPIADFSFTISPNVSGLGLVVELQAAVSDLSQVGTYPLPVFLSDRGTLTVGMAAPNDECTTAIPITDGLTSGDLTGVTTSSTTGSCVSMGSDIWYAYTAPCDGSAIVSFCTPSASSMFNTALAAFSGTCGSLTEIACSGFACAGNAEITFPATMGTTYYIVVGTAFGRVGGPFTVEVACVPPPANDDCAAASPINEGMTTGTTAGATTGSITGGCSMANEVWYRYLAPATGALVVECNSCIRPLAIAAFDAACVNQIACEAFGSPRIVFPVTAGTFYSIAVGDVAGLRGGPFTIDVSFVLPPVNDECANAIPIQEGLTSGSSIAATTSAVTRSCLMEDDVWYSYSPTCTGAARVSFCTAGASADFDAAVSVFEGSCGSLSEVACNINACGPRPEVEFPAMAGSTYYIAVGSNPLRVDGSFTFDVSCTAWQPSSACATAIPLVDGLTGGDASIAQPGPTPGPCGLERENWYRYTASCTGTATISMCGPGTFASPGFDPVLAAFDGSCAAPNLLACNDDTCGVRPEISFPVTAGSTYLIVLGGIGGSAGLFVVSAGCQ